MSQSGKLPVKLYYRIGEVAEIVGVEPHVLRYWETEFRTIKPAKSRKGQRIYSRRDVEKLLRVKDLLYTHGFTIAGARKQLRDAKTKTSRAPEGQRSGHRAAKLRTALQEIRAEASAFLAELEGRGVLPAPPDS